MNRNEFENRIYGVVNLFKNIEKTSKVTAKKALLSSYEDKDFLKNILLYTYNPYFVYGINKKTFSEDRFIDNTQINEYDLFTILDMLKSLNGVSEQTKQNLRSFVASFEDENISSLIKRIILKDLKIGINIETINSVFRSLIPTFKVCLCETYEKESDLRHDYYAVQPKLDGVRATAIVKDCGSVEIFTRNGSKIDGYDTIVNELSNFPGFVFDGEIIGDDFKDTMESLFALGSKKKAVYNIFDCLTLKEFNEKKVKRTYRERYDEYISIISEGYESIKALSCLMVSRSEFIETADEMLKMYEDEGYEGLVIKGTNTIYNFKRSYDWIKYKSMITEEFDIVDFEEGQGKYSGILGAIYVSVNGVLTKVGSGFTDEQRAEIWFNKDKFYWKKAEIKYQEKTPDGKLRFPVFIKIRNDI